jgi:hypothetical protein
MSLLTAYKVLRLGGVDGREEFLDEVRRKGAKLGKRMVYEKKLEMQEKYLKTQHIGFFG